MPRFDLSASIRQLLGFPQVAAFLPAVALGAYWLAGEQALVGVALGAPIVMYTYAAPRRETRVPPPETPLQGATERLNRIQMECLSLGRKSACFVLCVDSLDVLISRHGAAGVDSLMGQIPLRLLARLRTGDQAFRISDDRFVVALEPTSRCDLESAIQLSGRLQEAIEAPMHLDETALYLSASCGFCLNSASPEGTGKSMIQAAEVALEEARAQGGGSIRAYTEAMKSRHLTQGKIADEVDRALETGQVRAWFQPQVSSDTGEVTGFEALARWEHPERGMMPPGDFLPAIESAGLLPRLAEVMLHEALHALKFWDAEAGGIPTVSINLSQAELSDPNFPEKTKWALDRFDVPADRICFEILEDVVATGASDVVTRNLAKLAKMGCKIDLDDFGTGQTSITAIRRLSVNRLKIDRSFITRLHEDKEQQKMVEAILTMAERLGLETVAEGVETVGEHARASQLGCTYIQGFAVSRPLPLEKTAGWITHYRSKLARTPEIRRNAG